MDKIRFTGTDEITLKKIYSLLLSVKAETERLRAYIIKNGKKTEGGK